MAASASAGAAAADWATLFEEGLPMREDGTFDEPEGIIERGLARLRADLRTWFADPDNEAKAREDLEEGGYDAPPASASFDELAKAYLPRTDKAFLLAFLRCRRYEMKEVVKVLVGFTSMWRTHPDWTEGLTAEEFRESYGLGYYRVLRERDADGNVITVMNPAQLDFGDGFDPMPWFRSSMLMAMYAADNPLWQHKGCTVFVTLRNMTMVRAWRMAARMRDPEMSSKMKQVYKDSMPNRLRRIVIADAPLFFNIIWTAATLLLPAKLLKRVVFAGSNAEMLAEVIPPSAMPADLGGENEEPFHWWVDDVVAAEKAGWSPYTGWPEGRPPEGFKHGHGDGGFGRDGARASASASAGDA